MERTSGRPIGQAGLLRQEVESRLMVGLGCILHHAFWLHGFATEAAAACLDYAFARLELPEVIALVRPENLPSQGLVRKLGMARKRLIRYEALPHLLYVAERPAVSTPAEPTPNENENHLTGPDAFDG